MSVRRVPGGSVHSARFDLDGTAGWAWGLGRGREGGLMGEIVRAGGACGLGWGSGDGLGQVVQGRSAGGVRRTGWTGEIVPTGLASGLGRRHRAGGLRQVGGSGWWSVVSSPGRRSGLRAAASDPGKWEWACGARPAVRASSSAPQAAASEPGKRKRARGARQAIRAGSSDPQATTSEPGKRKRARGARQAIRAGSSDPQATTSEPGKRKRARGARQAIRASSSHPQQRRAGGAGLGVGGRRRAGPGA
jgi:hypothetical protein